MEDKKQLVTAAWFRTDVFDIVDTFPAGYILWNIGRQNFPFSGYIPLARPTEDENVDVTTLKAIKVADEKTALRLMRLSIRGLEINQNNFSALTAETARG